MIQKAEGMRAMMAAQADGMQRMLEVAPADLVKFYLALENGLFVSLADKTADAVRGMQPKINVWNTGAGGEGGADAMAPLRNIFTSLPPMLDALGTQTNVQLPSWLPRPGAEGGASGDSSETTQAAPQPGQGEKLHAQHVVRQQERACLS